MFAYLLLRNNKQSGPYSLEELKSFGIRANDLLWIEGRSTSWSFPDEIEELLPFVHLSPIASRHHSNTPFTIDHKEELRNDFRFNDKNEKRSTLPIEKKSKPKRETENEQINRRSQELRKSIFSRSETRNISFSRNYDSSNHQTSAPKFSLPDAIRIIIADDHKLFREGVKTALSQKTDVRIIGEAENGMQLLNLLKHNRPDVVLLDIQMPIMDGISALTSIRKLYADMKVIILSMHEGHSMVSTLMESGANGYLTKIADPETIYQAIKTTFEKNYYFNELTNVSMLEELRSKKKTPEKISTASFDGAEMMHRLTEARKKTSNYYSSNTQRGVLIAAGLALLIGIGAIAGMSLFGRPEAPQKPSVPAQVVDVPQEIPKPSPAVISPVQTNDSSKTQSPDSLQAKANDAISPEEKTTVIAGAKKDAPEAHATKKIKDSLKALQPVPVQKIDSSAKIHNDAPAKQSTSATEDIKPVSKNNIRNLVTASANNYHVGAFGGLSEIEITVNNRSSYNIDEVTVEVQYILSNDKLYKTETLNFQNIQPSSSAVLKAPKSSRGAKIDYRITSVKSKELD